MRNKLIALAVALLLFFSARGAEPDPGIKITPNPDGTATLEIINYFHVFMDLCVQRGYLEASCQQIDVDSGACQVLGEKLPTTICDSTKIGLQICRPDLEGQTIPIFLNCGNFLSGRARESLRNEIIGGRRKLVDLAKPAVDTTDPFPASGAVIELAAEDDLPSELLFHLSN